MFVRFRQYTDRLLQISIIETRRIDGKVRHELVARLGSVAVPPSVPDRLAFWQLLYERFAKLPNRVDAATQDKLLGQIHARIPMVIDDKQHNERLDD
jgi:hypothetical protein